MPSSLLLLTTFVDDILVIEPDTIIDQHTITIQGVPIKQLLVKWKDRDIYESTWENQEEVVMPAETSDLEDKVILNDGGVDTDTTQTQPKRTVVRPVRYRG